MACKHEQFQAMTAVHRLEDTGRFMATFRITCVDCNKPMQFMGLPPGLKLDGATVSLCGEEMTIAIHPVGERPTPLQELKGYTIKNTH